MHSNRRSHSQTVGISSYCNGARIFNLGECAIVLELTQANKNAWRLPQQAIWQLDTALRERWLTRHCIRDIVPGDGNITVIFEPLLTNATCVQNELNDAWQALAAAKPGPAAPVSPQSQLHELEIVYGGERGPDLAPLAEYHQLSTQQLIELHCAVEYRVAFLGFQPGFAYLHGLDARLHAPRRSQPRLQVAANSLAIGGSQTGIYPAASPGGWHIIGGYSGAQGRLFDIKRKRPNLLAPGERVRFVPIKAAVNA